MHVRGSGTVVSVTAAGGRLFGHLATRINTSAKGKLVTRFEREVFGGRKGYGRGNRGKGT